MRQIVHDHSVQPTAPNVICKNPLLRKIELLERLNVTDYSFKCCGF